MKTLILIAILLATGTSYAQTDAFNLKKYWKFRNTFVEQFVKIGGLQGESFSDKYKTVNKKTHF